MTTEQELRAQLADELSGIGILRSPQLHAAVEHVPRHLFVPEFFRPVTIATGAAWEPVTAASLGAAEWMRLAYQNQTWVTQLDEHIRPRGADGKTMTGNPTSSSTLPGLVLAMLEDLELDDDCTVLEIGTGSGYSTALLCDRLGSENVVSIEADPQIASDAAQAIHTAGYAPTLVTADGLHGFEPSAPYNRVIATCSVRNVPPAWIRQSAPGAIVLTTLSGWQYGSAYARLTVNADGTASGNFLPDTYSFMLARPHLPPTLNLSGIKDLSASPSRPARITFESLDDWTARFIGQLASPDAQYTARKVADGPMVEYLIDAISGSTASLTPHEDGIPDVREHGPIALWSRVEQAITSWQHAGSPRIEQFRIEVGPDFQRVYLPGDESLNWVVS